MTIDSLKNIYIATEGSENRLKSSTYEVADFRHSAKLLGTKRYTYTHIQRPLMNASLNIRPTNVTSNTHVVKVLAVNDRGRQYLKHLKTAFPERRYTTNTNKSNAHYFTNEIRATYIYNTISGQ